MTAFQISQYVDSTLGVFIKIILHSRL